MSRVADITGVSGSTLSLTSSSGGRAVLAAPAIGSGVSQTLTFPAFSCGLLGVPLGGSGQASGYTTTASDYATFVRIGNGTGANAAVTLGSTGVTVGVFLWLQNYGLGTLTIASPDGVAVINGKPQISAPFGTVFAFKSSASWSLFGDLDVTTPRTTTGNDTLAWGDQFGGILCNSTSAATETVPQTVTADGETLSFPLGAAIPVRQGAAGAVTIAAASGVTLNAPYGLSTTGVGDMRMLEQTAANVWSVY